MSQLKNWLISLIIISLSNTASAEDAVYLVKGDSAPYAGVLMPLEKVQELRRNIIEFDSVKTLNASLNKSIEIYKTNEALYDKKIEILNNQNLKLSESLYNAHNSSTIEKVLYFSLGALIAGVTSYGIYKAAIAK